MKAGTTYAIRAVRGATTRRGTCTKNAGVVVCSVRAPTGTWRVTITARISLRREGMTIDRKVTSVYVNVALPAAALAEKKATLTSGSTWHAAGGMHTLNGDPNVARLQQYTVNLYKQIEAESGQNCGIHLPGGIQLADTPERLDWLRMAQARGRYLGMHMEIISVKEAKELNPLLEEKYFVGALYDEDEGSVDPTGVTHAYTICARNRGAEVYQHTWVNALERCADGTWNVHTFNPASTLMPTAWFSLTSHPHKQNKIAGLYHP